MEPIRTLGDFALPINLTLDLVPEIQVYVRREGEVAKASPVKPAAVEPEVMETVEETPAEE